MPAGDKRLMRLPPLPGDQWDERERAALAGLLPEHRRNPRGAGNALATLVRHPDLTETSIGGGGERVCMVPAHHRARN